MMNIWFSSTALRFPILNSLRGKIKHDILGEKIIALDWSNIVLWNKLDCIYTLHYNDDAIKKKSAKKPQQKPTKQKYLHPNEIFADSKWDVFTLVKFFLPHCFQNSSPEINSLSRTIWIVMKSKRIYQFHKGFSKRPNPMVQFYPWTFKIHSM